MTKEQLLDKAIAALRKVQEWHRNDKKGLGCSLSLDINQVLEYYDCLGAKYNKGDEVWILDRDDFRLVHCKVSWVVRNTGGFIFYQLHELTGRNLGQHRESEVFATMAEAEQYWGRKLGDVSKYLLH